MSTSRKRPPSPSSPSSSDDDSSLPRPVLLGTPLDRSERSHRRVARERAARRRERGVGEGTSGGEAFVPASFVSSRGRRAGQREGVGVEEYRDERDEEGERREGLQVRGEIEGGGGVRRVAKRAGGEDPLLATLELRHESVAMRMLRRMRLSGGGGRGRGREGKRHGPSSAQGKAGGAKARPKRKLYTVALPPSMQAMMEDDAEEEKTLTHAPLPTPAADEEADADDDDDDDEPGSPLSPLPSVPLFSPATKADRHGLGYDPLAYASEFRAHRARERERRKAAEDADVLDGDVLEVRMSGKGGGGGGGGKGGKERPRRVPGFMVGHEEEDDEEVDVYEDRAEYDEEIGRRRVDKGKEREEEERKAEALSAAQEPMTFVKAKESAAHPPQFPAIVVPDGWDEKKRWDDREAVESIRSMKEAVREYAEKSRRDREDRERQRRALVQQLHLQRDERKEDGQPREARPPAAPPALTSPLPQPPPPSAAASLPATAAFPTTEEMLASGFFSKFTASSDASASSTPAPTLPLPPPATTSSPTASATLAPPPKIGLYGPDTREVQPWQPAALLCRRLGVEMPIVERGKDAPAMRGAGDGLRSASEQGTRGRRVRGGPVGRLQEVAALEEADLRAPPIVADRPPAAVFKAIFEEAEEPAAAAVTPINGVGTASSSSSSSSLLDALQLLSSIPAPALTSAPPPPSFVHPSRQHLVSAPVHPPPPSEPRARASRWGDKVAAALPSPAFPTPRLLPVPSLPAPPVLSPSSFQMPPSAPPSVFQHTAMPPPATVLPQSFTPPTAPPSASAPSAVNRASVATAAATAVPSLKASLVAELVKLEEQSAAEKARKGERKKERKADKERDKDRKERRHSSSHSSAKKERRKRKKNSGSSRSSRVEYALDDDSSSSSSLEMHQVVDLT